MALNDDIKDLLSEFGLKLTVDTKASLRSKLDERTAKHGGRKRISRLENSAKALPITYSGGVLRFTFQMNDYWDVVDGGRKASNVSEEGQEKIAEWSGLSGLAEKIRISDLYNRMGMQRMSLSDRKLKKLKKMPFDRAKKAAGFLVARSLKKKTIEPTNFFTDVIRDGRIEELQKKLSELIKTDIIINISN
jgi:hypothetical protein